MRAIRKMQRVVIALFILVLLAFCGWRVFSMGVELLPTITSNEAIVTLSTTKDLSKEDSYAIAGKAMEAMLEVDHVEEVDYLSGDDAYKADWMAQRRERVGLVAFDRHRPRGWLAAGRAHRNPGRRDGRG